jgi:hypothetical protein
MAMVHDPELEGRFPNHAAFVSSDAPHFSAFVSEATGEGRPVVVAFPGGGYMIVEGPTQPTSSSASCISPELAAMLSTKQP